MANNPHRPVCRDTERPRMGKAETPVRTACLLPAPCRAMRRFRTSARSQPQAVAVEYRDPLQRVNAIRGYRWRGTGGPIRDSRIASTDILREVSGEEGVLPWFATAPSGVDVHQRSNGGEVK